MALIAGGNTAPPLRLYNQPCPATKSSSATPSSFVDTSPLFSFSSLWPGAPCKSAYTINTIRSLTSPLVILSSTTLFFSFYNSFFSTSQSLNLNHLINISSCSSRTPSLPSSQSPPSSHRHSQLPSVPKKHQVS
jgi:hypothetical protein